MTSRDRETPGKRFFRILTPEEMEVGLDVAAWQVLSEQAEYLRRRRHLAPSDEILESFAQQNRELAERRLVSGLHAYIQLEGMDGIVRQMPDGTRDLIEIVDGAVTVMRRLPPADTTRG